MDTWTAVKPPSIFHAVKQLAREGLLEDTGATDNPRGPARVVYRATAAGEREFFRLLKAALFSPDIEEFGAGVAFMRSLPSTYSTCGAEHFSRTRSGRTACSTASTRASSASPTPTPTPTDH